MAEYVVYTECPASWLQKSLIRVAGCAIFSEGAVLLIRRGPQMSFADQYETPGGKIEEDEDPRVAAIREVREEVGIDVTGTILFVGMIYTAPAERPTEVDYMYYIYQAVFKVRPLVVLEEQFGDARWVKPHELNALPLVVGTQEELALCGWPQKCDQH